MSTATILLALLSGGLIGMVLGLVGGGGSILAVPLLVYVVGVTSPHVAIGTAAVAVAVNAALGLSGHARAGTVKWPCALVFAASGMAGSLIGAALGKALDGERILGLFGLMMIGIGLSMLRPRRTPPQPDVHLDRSTAGHLLPRLVPIGIGAGLLAGFFGIGGGFLIVPGLIAATAMPLVNAIGTSLVAVTAFGLTTASSYALSGYINWGLAGVLIAGGAIGGLAGIRLGRGLAGHKRTLDIGFAVMVVAVGLFVAGKSLKSF